MDVKEYRKRPVKIQAVQWTGENINEIYDFVGEAQEISYVLNELSISTLEGWHHASKGDFIIKGVKGEFYPCKPDIFEETYISDDSMNKMQEVNKMDINRIVELLESESYKDRARGEYLFVKDKYEKLHNMIIKREAGKLEFSPNCPMEQWKAQAAAMGAYLYQLEIKAEIENIEL